MWKSGFAGEIRRRGAFCEPGLRELWSFEAEWACARPILPVAAIS
jgi:hypothetical protein